MLMMRRRLWFVAIPLILLLAGAGILLYLRKQAPPQAARLLPETDVVLFLDFSDIRLATKLADQPVIYEAEFADFVNATGFKFERDLDQLAIAFHPAEAAQTDAGSEMQRRYSEVFIGRYDATRMNHYLHKLASNVERYKDSDIFTIPHDGRTVRVALLNASTVAGSNTNSDAHIKGMIDRFQKISAAVRGPEVLQENFSRVPLGSTAWAMARFEERSAAGSSLPTPFGFAFDLPQGTVMVASLRFLGSIHFRAEAVTPNEEQAKELADTLSTYLALFRAAEVSIGAGGPDSDVKQLFQTLKVEQEGRAAIFTADVPAAFVKKLFTEQGKAAEKPAAPPAPAKK